MLLGIRQRAPQTCPLWILAGMLDFNVLPCYSVTLLPYLQMEVGTHDREREK